MRGFAFATDGESESVVAQLSATSPKKTAFNEGGSLQTRLKEGASYELSKWLKGAWQSMATVDASDKPTRSELAIDGLSWLEKKPHAVSNGPLCCVTACNLGCNLER